MWRLAAMLMSWLWAAIGGAFSGLAQGFLALFGMSTAQKLGRAETKLATDDKLLQEVKNADEVQSVDARLSDDSLKLQFSRFKRPD
jgi:phosphopantetheine adenylyltransferase